jgi:hypothetical protein
LPNPLLLFAAICLLRGRRRAALVASALAFLGGLFVPLMYTIYRADDYGADDAFRVCVGYWLRLASLGLPAVFSEVRAVRARRPAAYVAQAE